MRGAFYFLTGLVWSMLAAPLQAISPDNRPAADNSPEAERAAFRVHEDFSIDLFADESLGIANPIALHWDARGRLWVLCTLAYAQLKPGKVPDDKLFILEDTNADGRADRSTVFADGLDMPMGFALGHGGAWVAQGPDLLHLRDTDGDDRADVRDLVLTGFGTGDTHQNISNLIFDAGGFLYFSQGLHTFSQVETPWGVARGDSAGFWRFDPRLTRLSPFGFPSMTSANPCGVALDRWGALFVKSNGPHLCFATPGLIPTTKPRELMQSGQVGQTPGKSMGGDIVASAHLPAWIQENAVIAGYFAREVSAIPLAESGSGFAISQPVQLVYGGHESFRPVDIRQGPDGAIYIADWFNPIINHYQVSLRHPDRDYTHGRVWRLSAKGRAPMKRPALEKMGAPELVEQIQSAERWPRQQARRLLSDDRETEKVFALLTNWLGTLDPARDALALTEAAGVLESLGAVTPELLDRLASSPEPRARAVVARVISRFADPVPGAGDRLARLIADPHPRPRLEAVVACANLPRADSLRLALGALDFERDRFLDYALGQTVIALEPHWWPALQSGALTLENPAHLAFALETRGGDDAADLARRIAKADDHPRLWLTLARLGNAADMGAVFTRAARTRDAELLEALALAAETRGIIPEKVDDSSLAKLVTDSDPGIAALGLRLAGWWKATGLAGEARRLLLDDSTPMPLRTTAALTVSQLSGKAEAPATLRPLVIDPGKPVALRKAALEALARADLPAAATLVVDLAKNQKNDASTAELLPSLLSRSGGPAALAAVFEKDAPDSGVAQSLLDAMNRLGRIDPKLTPILNRAIGRQTGAPPYDAARVAAMVEAIRAGKADVKRGREIFLQPQLACMACHRVGDAGGVIGPSLNGVGAGLPLDQIVESILWPDRQIKEGYQAVAFTTRAGAAITGYIEREGDDMVWYRNTTAPWILPLAKKDIASREAIPTLMPAGLTQSLKEDELRDLAAYLASLKG
jgi:putative heme-binding domain-containing protein